MQLGFGEKTPEQTVRETPPAIPWRQTRWSELSARHNALISQAEAAHLLLNGEYDDYLKEIEAMYRILTLVNHPEIASTRLRCAKELVKQRQVVDQLEDRAAVTRGDGVVEELHGTWWRLFRLSDQLQALERALYS